VSVDEFNEKLMSLLDENNRKLLALGCHLSALRIVLPDKAENKENCEANQAPENCIVPRGVVEATALNNGNQYKDFNATVGSSIADEAYTEDLSAKGDLAVDSDALTLCCSPQFSSDDYRSEILREAKTPTLPEWKLSDETRHMIYRGGGRPRRSDMGMDSPDDELLQPSKSDQSDILATPESIFKTSLLHCPSFNPSPETPSTPKMMGVLHTTKLRDIPSTVVLKASGPTIQGENIDVPSPVLSMHSSFSALDCDVTIDDDDQSITMSPLRTTTLLQPESLTESRRGTLTVVDQQEYKRVLPPFLQKQVSLENMNESISLINLHIGKNSSDDTIPLDMMIVLLSSSPTFNGLPLLKTVLMALVSLKRLDLMVINGTGSKSYKVKRLS
jgi:hypothetical protein